MYTTHDIPASAAAAYRHKAQVPVQAAYLDLLEGIALQAVADLTAEGDVPHALPWRLVLWHLRRVRNGEMLS